MNEEPNFFKLLKTTPLGKVYGKFNFKKAVRVASEPPFLLAHTHIKRNDVDSRQQKSPFVSILLIQATLIKYDFEKGKSSTAYILRDSKTGKMTELAFANKVPRGLRTEKKFIAHGRAIGNKFEVDEMVAGLQDEPSAEEESAEVAEAGTGIHHAIVMILNMSDAPGEAISLSADNTGPLYFNNNHIGQVQGKKGRGKPTKTK